jgi:hypothetical protein
MYDVDERDLVTPLEGVPQCDPGAPVPMVIAAEGTAIVAYYAPLEVDWDTARPEDIPEDGVVVLQFGGVLALMFGAPNDEALHGHPLAGRGLDAYGAYRVEHSSWVRRLERMSRVHPQHSPERFSRLQHFVLTFHDSTLECVASAPPNVSVLRGTTPRQAVVDAAPQSGSEDAPGCCFEAEPAARPTRRWYRLGREGVSGSWPRS